MKKKSSLLLVLILFILLSLLFSLWYFVLRNTNTDVSQTKEPYLELSVSSYPTLVDTICQRVEFVIEAKNTGNESLRYEDIEEGKYLFSFVKSDTWSIVGSTEGNSQEVHNLYVEDFGEIRVGDTKELSFYLKDSYIGGQDFGYTNGLNLLQSNGNGIYSFYFEFQRSNGENSYTMISNLPEISIDIQAFVFSNEYWSNKICN